METAGDGATPYQSGVPRGRLWRKTIRRSVQAAPYDQPPTALRKNSPSLVANLLHPPSRPIYAGDDRSFGVSQRCEEAKPSTDKGGNLGLEASFNTLRLEASTSKHHDVEEREKEYMDASSSTAIIGSTTNNNDSVDSSFSLGSGQRVVARRLRRILIRGRSHWP